MSFLYHPGKVNVVTNSLSRLSVGSTAHIEEAKRELAGDVHKLARLGVKLIDSAEEGIAVVNGDESSLVVGINLPTVEVRFEHLTIETNCYIEDRALSTLLNAARNIVESALSYLRIMMAEKTNSPYLKMLMGLSNLLGPPSSGKTTLLLALAGKLDQNLKVRGEITYNGYDLEEIVPQKTSAYIRQHDIHVGEMTVKEILDFFARCQGELTKREREAGIFPKAEIDLFMKATAVEEVESSLITDYMLREMKDHLVSEDKLQLLHGVTGAFRPGVLTALMGVSGAGKTTLMDVLAGPKTGGYIEGDVRISGFPKKQETFARVSGYCEQTDIHSPQVTVHESLIFSAFLQLPKEVSNEDKMIFVDEVMDLVELDNLKDAIVGLPGVTGLSAEQKKRLTIAVELVANPSIIFMDEPTSGLDARAAAIVVRTVRNTVDTGRTVVCTIHQPSIDIFEEFDELLLVKKGGQLIYAGPLGRHSQKIIEYFEAIPAVPKIKEKCNPATWMLDSSWGQFKSCLWKEWWTHWRSPNYNLVRFFFSLAAALMVGTIFWKVGSKRSVSITGLSKLKGLIVYAVESGEGRVYADLTPTLETISDLTTIIGAMYTAVLFVGINNCSTVQAIVAVGRTVFYRERAAGMYSALPYAMAQVISEIPYIIIQTTDYTLIVYTMVGFEFTAAKFFWLYFVTFFSFLYFTYYGLMTIAITPNHHVASIFAAAFFSLFNLFSGFFIPRPNSKVVDLVLLDLPGGMDCYGDVEDTIKVPGMSIDPKIKDYIIDHFGYNLNFMGLVATVLVGFAVFYAFVYSYSIKALNFQRR
ncbi:hypothetical protein H5410_062481 [Solanum commersonii]|uniref:ABC transporter domain-containing protein n=1 Tax=Solanum commersonii TaxID=4109 RepID=A0A9J5WAH4_SOLCO|nr:hypothetical protein H5410_062481 [Solanum commersonii]